MTNYHDLMRDQRAFRVTGRYPWGEQTDAAISYRAHDAVFEATGRDLLSCNGALGRATRGLA